MSMGSLGAAADQLDLPSATFLTRRWASVGCNQGSVPGTGVVANRLTVEIRPLFRLPVSRTASRVKSV